MSCPSPSEANHEPALRWFNHLLGIDDVRSVALVQGENPVWSVNLRGHLVPVEPKNLGTIRAELQRKFGNNAKLHRVEPLKIWLPNSVKSVWSITVCNG